MGQLILAPKKAASAGQCTAKSYAGAWSRPGTGEQRAQVRLQFDDPAATKQPMGRVSGFNASPYGEGNWTRTDGAQISVAGVRFKDGGNALLYNHPTGGWPQGAFKFSQIKSKGACDWEAQCATVYRDSAKGGFNTVRGACTLTVDPETKTMTASGTHGTFKR
jgi:hypothetical protein